MAQPTKYPLWDTNQTATSDPGAARESDGWQAAAGIPEKPPYQTFNHWMNNAYLWIKYINEQGIAEWDTTITYAIGAYVIASDNLLYRALISQAGNTPVADPTNWQPVGDLINTLVSTDITRGLTAAQGKVLKDVQDIINTRTQTATITQEGVVEKATTAENLAGTSDVVYPSVKGVREEMFSATGSAPVFACRAWVNWDMDLAGSPSIYASGNVSSITDHGVGQQSINFTTAMPDTTYATIVSGQGSTDMWVGSIEGTLLGPLTSKTTSVVRLVFRNSATHAVVDVFDASMMIMR